MKIAYNNPKTGNYEEYVDVEHVELYFSDNIACVRFADKGKPILDLVLDHVRHIDEQ